MAALRGARGHMCPFPDLLSDALRVLISLPLVTPQRCSSATCNLILNGMSTKSEWRLRPSPSHFKFLLPEVAKFAHSCTYPGAPFFIKTAKLYSWLSKLVGPLKPEACIQSCLFLDYCNCAVSSGAHQAYDKPINRGCGTFHSGLHLVFMML